eukprot:10141269-Ditylum_brightwellii.AAC.1
MCSSTSFDRRIAASEAAEDEAAEAYSLAAMRVDSSDGKEVLDREWLPVLVAEREMTTSSSSSFSSATSLVATEAASSRIKSLTSRFLRRFPAILFAEQPLLPPPPPLPPVQ